MEYAGENLTGKPKITSRRWLKIFVRRQRLRFSNNPDSMVWVQPAPCSVTVYVVVSLDKTPFYDDNLCSVASNKQQIT